MMKIKSMLSTVLALVLVLGLSAGQAGELPDYSDLGFNDFKAVVAFVEQVKQCVAADDKPGVAALVSYPAYVTLDGQDLELADAAAFLAVYDKIFTPALKDSIAAQAVTPEDIFINRQGLLIGTGGPFLVGLPEDTGIRIGGFGLD
ncbi:hypothetical protein [Megalodesulfovibrio paquesii]